MQVTAKEKIRVLLLAANPSDTGALRLGEEARDIEDVLERAKLSSEVRHISAARPRDIPRKLRAFRPNFVHFSGHGERDEGILLEDVSGRATAVSKEALGALFKIFRGVKCVLLNSCESHRQAETIVTYVPYVVAMSEAISDRAAIEFSFGFYQAIGDGENIPTAFEYGKTAIMLAGISAEENIPLLFRKEPKKRPQLLEPSAETFALTNPLPKSSEELTEIAKDLLDFKGFKHARLLNASGPTDGRDIEAYTIGVDESGSTYQWKWWVEIKFLSETQPSIDDIRIKITHAGARRAHFFLLITNAVVPMRTQGEMETAASEARIQFRLWDRNKLKELQLERRKIKTPDDFQRVDLSDRLKEVGALKSVIQSRDYSAILIQGVAGVGKSALGRFLVHHLHRDYYCGMIDCRLSSDFGFALKMLSESLLRQGATSNFAYSANLRLQETQRLDLFFEHSSDHPTLLLPGCCKKSPFMQPVRARRGNATTHLGPKRWHSWSGSTAPEAE